MNRKNQGQPRRQNMQAQPRAQRSHSHNPNGYDQGSHEMNHNHQAMNAGSHPRSFSGDSSWSNGDTTFDTQRNSPQLYGDMDYDYDGSTYGQPVRSPKSMERNFSGRVSGMEYGTSFSDNDLTRSPLRYDRDENVYSSRFTPERHASSSERFGYPSNMNAWSHGDQSQNSLNHQGHMHSQDNNLFNQHSYGDAGPASFGSFGEDRSNRHDWGTQSSQRGFLGKGPKGYKRSDERIKEDVCETLSRDHRIDASDIEVNVDDALVTLSGHVDCRQTKRVAEMIIENLSGVEDVKNEIKVKKSGEMNNESLHASGINKNSTSNPTSKSQTTKGTGQI